MLIWVSVQIVPFGFFECPILVFAGLVVWSGMHFASFVPFSWLASVKFLNSMISTNLRCWILQVAAVMIASSKLKRDSFVDYSLHFWMDFAFCVVSVLRACRRVLVRARWSFDLAARIVETSHLCPFRAPASGKSWLWAFLWLFDLNLKVTGTDGSKLS